jgi:amidase
MDAEVQNGFLLTCSLGGAGPTVAVKDTIDVAGYPTRAGTRALEDAPTATRHARVVENMLAAGCRIVGKTVLHELAFGVTGVNAYSGTPLNPGFPALIPGGSSSGSAATVARGLVDFAIGTDTGGSIRMPAACCGIFGLKPSYGRVSRDGVFPAQSSLDCVGPFAASLNGLERAMEAMDPGYMSLAAPLRAPVFGVVRVEADPAIEQALSKALAQAGVACRPIVLPSLGSAFVAGLTIINAENFAAFAYLLAGGKLGPDVAARLARAGETTKEEVAAAEAVRARFVAEVDAALDDVDALVLPTLPGFPMGLAEALAGKTDLRATTLVRPFNLSGHPALAAPLAPVEGQPVSLQIVGRRGADAELCAAARLLFPDIA